MVVCAIAEAVDAYLHWDRSFRRSFGMWLRHLKQMGIRGGIVPAMTILVNVPPER